MSTRKTINVRINDFNLIEILYFKNHILNSNNRGLKMYYFLTLKHSTHWKISNKTQFYLAILNLHLCNLTDEKNYYLF